MGGGDGLAALKVGDGAGHPQNAVVAAAGETEAVKGVLHQLFAGCIQRAVLSDHRRCHIGIAADRRAFKAALLNLAGGIDSCADGGGGFRRFAAAHRFIVHRRHFDVHIDAVHQGA